MPALEDMLTKLAREFAGDVVAALRGARVEDLVDATQPAARRRIGRTEHAGPPGSAIGIRAAIAETARAYHLNEREVAILTLATRAETRDAICRALGTNENTLKTQARGLLRKVGRESLSDAAIAVLHRAIGSSAVVLPAPARPDATNGTRRRGR